jgi:hypothetical protein
MFYLLLGSVLPGSDQYLAIFWLLNGNMWHYICFEQNGKIPNKFRNTLHKHKAQILCQAATSLRVRSSLHTNQVTH